MSLTDHEFCDEHPHDRDHKSRKINISWMLQIKLDLLWDVNQKIRKIHDCHYMLPPKVQDRGTWQER